MLSGQTGTLDVTELTPAADIYSLAKSAYVLITCESPRFFTNQPITELPFANAAKILGERVGRSFEKSHAERYRQTDIKTSMNSGRICPD